MGDKKIAKFANEDLSHNFDYSSSEYQEQNYNEMTYDDYGKGTLSESHTPGHIDTDQIYDQRDNMSKMESEYLEDFSIQESEKEKTSTKEFEDRAKNTLEDL